MREKSDSPEVARKADKFVTLFAPISGVSISGYFEVNRALLVGISSYIMTFVIILVEFKLSDLRGSQSVG